jgi:hypothetical protein
MQKKCMKCRQTNTQNSTYSSAGGAIVKCDTLTIALCTLTITASAFTALFTGDVEHACFEQKMRIYDHFREMEQVEEEVHCGLDGDRDLGELEKLEKKIARLRHLHEAEYYYLLEEEHKAVEEHLKKLEESKKGKEKLEARYLPSSSKTLNTNLDILDDLNGELDRSLGGLDDMTWKYDGFQIGGRKPTVFKIDNFA